MHFGWCPNIEILCYTSSFQLATKVIFEFIGVPKLASNAETCTEISFTTTNAELQVVVVNIRAATQLSRLLFSCTKPVPRYCASCKTALINLPGESPSNGGWGLCLDCKVSRDWGNPTIQFRVSYDHELIDTLHPWQDIPFFFHTRIRLAGLVSLQ